MRAILFLCFTILSVPVFSQDKIDSFQALLQLETSNDSNRVNLLNDLGYQYWTLDPQQATIYAQEALELSKEIDYIEGKAFSFRSIGVSNWAQGNYDEALDYLLESLLLYQSLSDTLNIANVMMNTALIYSDQGSDTEALRYYTEALHTFEALGREKRYVNTANHISELFIRNAQYDQAMPYLQESLVISESINHPYGMATSYQNLGKLYLGSGSLDSAIIYINKAIVLQREISDVNGWGISLYNLAQAHVLKKNFLLADEYFGKAMEIANGLNSKKLKRDIYLGSSELKKKQGDWQEALKCLEKYQALNDSLQQAETVRRLTRLENKVEIERNQQELLEKEYELSILEKEASIDMLYRNILFVIVIAILIVSYMIWRQQRLKLKSNKALLKKNEVLAEKERENARLKELELHQEIEFKSKELTSYTVNFVQKNELLAKIQGELNLITEKGNISSKDLSSLKKLIEAGRHIDREWSDFKKHFEEVHKDFFATLKNRFPVITQNELKLCALLKLNMNLKEAASVLGISPESVKTARYRLRKKLNLDKDENLVDFIIHLESNIEN